MAAQDQWFRTSQQRVVFANTLWQDLQAQYSDVNSADYWRQRQQRMAYQYGIVEHLLLGAKNLSQAVLKQLANTRFDNVLVMPWEQIEGLLLDQDYLSPEAQQILTQIQSGDWADLIGLHAQMDFSVIAKQDEPTNHLIATQVDNDLINPDHWPVERWIRDLRALQSSFRDSMGEW